MFAREIEALWPDIPSEVSLEVMLLEQGLHIAPEQLNTRLRAAVESIESREEAVDAVLMGYGRCSSGSIGIGSSRFPIVIPRAHDCITLLLGSRERYLREFASEPGTYWYTPGFIDAGGRPGMSDRYSGVLSAHEERFEAYLAVSPDEEAARFVLEHLDQGWIRRYTRGMFIRTGLPGDDDRCRIAEEICHEHGWRFEETPADMGLFRDLISGRWDEERFLIVQPGRHIVAGDEHTILVAE